MADEEKARKLNELMDRISFALKDATLAQGFEIICKKITELEKENAELKEKLEMKDFFWEGCGFRKFKNIIQVKQYIEQLEEQIEKLKSDYEKLLDEKIEVEDRLAEIRECY